MQKQPMVDYQRKIQQIKRRAEAAVKELQWALKLCENNAPVPEPTPEMTDDPPDCQALYDYAVVTDGILAAANTALAAAQQVQLDATDMNNWAWNDYNANCGG